MAIAWILGIVFALLLIGSVALAIWLFGIKKTTGGALSVVLAFGMFLCLFCIPGSFKTVEAGEIAVVKTLGKVTGTREAGTHFDFWMTNTYEKYDAKVQNMDINSTAYSSDGQTMEIAMTVQWSIDQSKVKEIATQYGNLDAVANKLEKVAIERAKATLSQQSAMKIIETRATVSPEVEKAVKEAVDSSYYVSINTVVLTNIDFTDAFEKTVEDKMIAEQEKLKAQYEKEKAIINAERDLETAKLQADAKLYAAQQDAEAKKTIALAEAVATSSKIAKLAESLGYTVEEQTSVLNADTDKEQTVVTGYVITWTKEDGTEDTAGKQLILDYLKYLEYLATWNGELPEVVAGDNGFMITVPSVSGTDSNNN